MVFAEVRHLGIFPYPEHGCRHIEPYKVSVPSQKERYIMCGAVTLLLLLYVGKPVLKCYYSIGIPGVLVSCLYTGSSTYVGVRTASSRTRGTGQTGAAQVSQMS